VDFVGLICPMKGRVILSGSGKQRSEIAFDVAQFSWLFVQLGPSVPLNGQKRISGLFYGMCDWNEWQDSSGCVVPFLKHNSAC
jgi:hypothetical protein